MRVLLTGATGKLGAYLLQHLRSAGVSVTAWSGSQQAICLEQRCGRGPRRRRCRRGRLRRGPP
jgi:nucleoside-diphosphate-sugar epimerase